jgi:hypothetical protein
MIPHKMASQVAVRLLRSQCSELLKSLRRPADAVLSRCTRINSAANDDEECCRPAEIAEEGKSHDSFGSRIRWPIDEILNPARTPM